MATTLIIFCLKYRLADFNARDPQVVYDMNIMAIKLAENPEVRLPVMFLPMDIYFTPKETCTSY